MNTKALAILAILITGCSGKYYGLYYDSCQSYHRPDTALKLNQDGTFFYKFIYHDTLITGTWQADHNFITLRSDIFKKKRKPMTSAIKYINNGSIDLFKFSTGRLLPIGDSTRSGKCFLRKAKPNDTWWLDTMP